MLAHQLKPRLEPLLPGESEQPAVQTKRHRAVVSYLRGLFLSGLRARLVQPVQERRREARVLPGGQRRARRWEAQGHTVEFDTRMGAVYVDGAEVETEAGFVDVGAEYGFQLSATGLEGPRAVIAALPAESAGGAGQRHVEQLRYVLTVDGEEVPPAAAAAKRK